MSENMKHLMCKTNNEPEKHFSHENQKSVELIPHENAPLTIQKKKEDEKDHQDRSKYLKFYTCSNKCIGV
jgi:hypothetical protein